MGKAEIARDEQFLLFQQCFQMLVSQGRQKVSLCGVKGSQINKSINLYLLNLYKFDNCIMRFLFVFGAKLSDFTEKIWVCIYQPFLNKIFRSLQRLKSNTTSGCLNHTIRSFVNFRMYKIVERKGGEWSWKWLNTDHFLKMYSPVLNNILAKRNIKVCD